jgi:hypothetical protein
MVPWYGFDPCLPGRTSCTGLCTLTQRPSPRTTGSCERRLRTGAGGCNVCVLLLLFDLSKRSCNEKTIISVSRTGKLLFSLLAKISGTHTAEPSSTASWRQKLCTQTRPECNIFQLMHFLIYGSVKLPSPGWSLQPL